MSEILSESRNVLSLDEVVGILSRLVSGSLGGAAFSKAVEIKCAYEDLLAERDALKAELAAKGRQVSKLSESVKELKEYVRRSCLEIQSHRSRTDAEKDRLFQYAYRLYVEYDVEGRNVIKQEAHP